MNAKDRGSKNSPVNPAMLAVAREARGFTQAELAAVLQVTQSKISKIEAGILLPTPEDVEGIARLLDFPVSFFSWRDPAGGVPLNEIYHRKRQQVPAKVLTSIYATFHIRRLQLARLCQSATIDGDGFQYIDPDEHKGDIETIASMVRSQWGLRSGPVPNMTEAIEGAGGVVVLHDFSTRKVDAISTWVPSYPPLFFVNSAAPGDRCRFTLAHEVGHLIMHRVVGADAEAQADRFAAEFLMPAKEIRTDLRNLTVQRLAGLKQYWRVSMAALLYRAGTLEMISPQESTKLWKTLTRLGYRQHEPIEIPVEHPTLHGELIDFHRESLHYSADELAEWLGDYHIDEIRHSPDNVLRIAR